MKRYIIPAFLLTIALLALFSSPAAFGKDSSQGAGLDVHAQKANDFMELLVNGKYEDAAERFDDKVAEKLPPEKLKQLWQEICETLGEYKSHEKPAVSVAKEYIIAVVICNFKKAQIETSIVLNESGRISGLWFKPVINISQY